MDSKQNTKYLPEFFLQVVLKRKNDNLDLTLIASKGSVDWLYLYRYIFPKVEEQLLKIMKQHNRNVLFVNMFKEYRDYSVKNWTPDLYGYFEGTLTNFNFLNGIDNVDDKKLYVVCYFNPNEKKNTNKNNSTFKNQGNPNVQKKYSLRERTFNPNNSQRANFTRNKNNRNNSNNQQNIDEQLNMQKIIKKKFNDIHSKLDELGKYKGNGSPWDTEEFNTFLTKLPSYHGIEEDSDQRKFLFSAFKAGYLPENPSVENIRYILNLHNIANKVITDEFGVPFGFEKVKIPGDGNCFYYAVLEATRAKGIAPGILDEFKYGDIDGAREKQGALRKTITDYANGDMFQYSKSYDFYYIKDENGNLQRVSDGNGGSNFENLMEENRGNNQGGGLSLGLLEELYNFKARIFYSVEKTWGLGVELNSDDENVISLYKEGGDGGHYDYLIKKI